MKVAWLFPGQGAQKVGMGKALAAAFPAADRVFDASNEALGFDLKKLCFEGPEHELTLTANTQPAIVTTSCAILAALKELHPELQPNAAAGHSLGEYSALVAAGALSVADAVRIVRLRGQAMQDAVPAGLGAMLAVMGATPAEAEALCDAARGDDVLAPANFNCPGQVVIAGSESAVARARVLTKERKLKGIPLKVSAPFHCSLMGPAAEVVKQALSDTTIGSMAFPVVANVNAMPNQKPEQVADLLVRQVDGTVRWQQTVEWLANNGVTHALEIGPGKVLAGLVKKTTKNFQVLSVSDPESLSQVGGFLR